VQTFLLGSRSGSIAYLPSIGFDEHQWYWSW